MVNQLQIAFYDDLRDFEVIFFILPVGRAMGTILFEFRLKYLLSDYNSHSYILRTNFSSDSGGLKPKIQFIVGKRVKRSASKYIASFCMSISEYASKLVFTLML